MAQPQSPGAEAPASARPSAPLWHVTLTVCGDPHPVDDVSDALERLAHERPFLLTARYAADRAEIRYWEEAETLVQASDMALRIWAEHAETAGLPPWRPVGLEVLDRDTYHLRFEEGFSLAALVRAGDIRHF